MNIKILLLGVVLLISAHSQVQNTPVEKPNFLFIFSDDQRYDLIGALGQHKVLTPNLDGLVMDGFGKGEVLADDARVFLEKAGKTNSPFMMYLALNEVE